MVLRAEKRELQVQLLQVRGKGENYGHLVRPHEAQTHTADPRREANGQVPVRRSDSHLIIERATVKFLQGRRRFEEAREIEDVAVADLQRRQGSAVPRKQQQVVAGNGSQLCHEEIQRLQMTVVHGELVQPFSVLLGDRALFQEQCP